MEKQHRRITSFIVVFGTVTGLKFNITHSIDLLGGPSFCELSYLTRFESVNVSDASLIKEYPTLKQAVARVSGTKRKDMKKWEMIKSLLPSGSVSGAPRSRVIPHLDAAEKHSRGIYCGAMGWWAYGGDFKLSLPIRTFVADGKNLEYNVGSGITWRSDPKKEWEECKIKSNCLNESFKGVTAWGILLFGLVKIGKKAILIFYRYRIEKVYMRLF